MKSILNQKPPYLRHLTLLMITWVVLLLSGNCRQGKEPAYGTNQWRGQSLTGEQVQFASLGADRVVINFYSPTCQPCIEELPALNALYRKLKEQGVPFYMAVESWPEAHGLPLPDTAPRAQIEAELKKRLQEDVKKYDIELPIVLMHPDFKINNEYGLVTGTPETLVFDLQPSMELKYNFIGPLSTAHDIDRVEGDSRLYFAYRKAVGEI